LAVLGCLCFSPATADEIKDQRGNILYGKITGFTAQGVTFQQNCAGDGQTFAWTVLGEARFSGDCSAAKSWRGGGDPSCEDRAEGAQWIEKPGLVSLEVMPEIVPEGEVPPYGTATELLSRDGNAITYRDVCTGKVKSMPTGDLVMVPTPGYCSIECK
jgi:hypothetical protein